MKQTFIQHMHELRNRLSVLVAVLVLGAALGYCFRDQILAWLQAPLHATLYYGDVMGAFNYLMFACLVVGLLLAIPVLVYNLIAFVHPALPQPFTRAQILRLVVLSYGLTWGGAAFAYYVSLPLVLLFLTSVDISHLHQLIAAGSYLSFVIAYLAIFAAVFQLPLLLLFLDHITPIPPASLKRWRKWVIIGAFGVAIILPIVPDPVAQVMLALPVVLLYEISLWLIVLAHRRRSRRLSSPAPTAQPHPVVKTQLVTERRPSARPDSRPAMRKVMDPTVSLRPPIIDMRPPANRPAPPGYV
jgi:sec-independent protein translocase protein TatC